MENYYNDSRVIQSSEELMDILTFIKEIKDNLGFDVLWDTMNGKRYTNMVYRY